MFEKLPAIKKGGPVKIIIGFDLSGSICADKFFRRIYRYYLSQLTGQLMYRDFIVKAVGWDTQIFTEMTFSNKNVLDMPDYTDHMYSSKRGCGGSAMEALYTYNEETSFNADCIITLTDGYIRFPEKEMSQIGQNIVIIINQYDPVSMLSVQQKQLASCKNTELVLAHNDD